jgi:predicted nucleic acid-binding protein
VSPALYLIDTSGLFRILQDKLRQAWSEQLTETGKHRSAGPVDLLIAATAERERLIVLCDDRDFLTVAAVTGQPVKLVTHV